MREFKLIVSPEIGFDPDNLDRHLRKKKILHEGQFFRLQRRSIDARSQKTKVSLTVAVDDQPLKVEFVEYKSPQHSVSDRPEVLIIGAGPAGLFAALRAIESGLKPIIIERGKDVRSRRRDIAAINKEHIVNPDSNYCFGEGGAGTYSDGKLYTRSKKRGSLRRVFEILLAHGAPENILYEAHPHIGTNKLPGIVAALRETIIERGGQVIFDARVVDFTIKNGRVTGVTLCNDSKIVGEAVVLATGHSARDIFKLLHDKKIAVEAKPFALGVRIEHPQQIIDRIQYDCDVRSKYLPASAYSVAYQTRLAEKQRGVFSFCMCPGGFIVPSATAPGEVVVNGMSPSRRDSRFANSGIVAAVELEDVPGYDADKPLTVMQFQAMVERKASIAAGGTQTAPAQRLMDFMENRISSSLPETSYQPGLASCDLRAVLPRFIHKRLRQGFKGFGRKMKGFLTNDAQIVGVESRTSSPVRIPRDPVTCEHPSTPGLFPAGEGAGYAGGIVSAAMDGERVMSAVVQVLKGAGN